jgi:hypothetical protein
MTDPLVLNRAQLASIAPVPVEVQRCLLRDSSVHLWTNPHLDNEVLAQLWQLAVATTPSWTMRVSLPIPSRPMPRWNDAQIDIGVAALDAEVHPVTRAALSAILAHYLEPGDPRWTRLCNPVADAFAGYTPRHARTATPGRWAVDPELIWVLRLWSDLVARPRTDLDAIEAVVEHLGVITAADYQLRVDGDRDVLAAAYRRNPEPTDPGSVHVTGTGESRQLLAVGAAAAAHPASGDALADAILAGPASARATILFTLCAPWHRHPELVEEFCRRDLVPVNSADCDIAALLCCAEIPEALRDHLRPRVEGGRPVDSSDVDLCNALLGPGRARIVTDAFAGDDPHMIRTLLRSEPHAVQHTQPPALGTLTGVCGSDPGRWELALELADGELTEDQLADAVALAYQ